MDAPPLMGVDHVHVFVADRPAAVRWYAQVMGMAPVAELAGWAVGGGPLTLADAAGSVHLALFESPAGDAPRNRSTVALRTSAAGLLAWRERLQREGGLAPTLEDHDLSLSLYFRDPDGNPYEITTYEHEAARAAGITRAAAPPR